MNTLHRCLTFGSLALPLLCAWPTATLSQPARWATQEIPYVLDSGRHDGSEGGADRVVYRGEIRVPGARWIRLHFSGHDLGARSLIRMTSVQNGARQHFDTRSILDYGNTSAFLNGDAVDVELLAAIEDSGIFFTVDHVITDMRNQGEPEPTLSLCGTDDRTRTTDPRVGRFCASNATQQDGNCTAWLAMNGALLTAWHCFSNIPSNLVVEFNVPDSQADGDYEHPGPEDQYPVDAAGRVTGGGGVGTGHDWAVFRCRANSETSLRPLERQLAFCRVTLDGLPTNATVLGYGTDCTNGPSGCTPNSDNGTLQTATGAFSGQHDEGNGTYTIRYAADTQGGESGAPVYKAGTTSSIGIHTYGACPEYGYNWGTGFATTELRDGLNGFSSFFYVFADNGHESPNEDGTLFRPYGSIAGAVANSAAGDTVCVAGGGSDYTGVTTITGYPLTLIAKGGLVTLRP